jgi:TPR repeat protein
MPTVWEDMRWYRMAADRGNAVAQNEVGFFYQNGLGVSVDYAEALRWYRLAADQGDTLAQYRGALLYDRRFLSP